MVFVVGGGVWDEYASKYRTFLSKIPENLVINLGYVDDNYVYDLYENAMMLAAPSLYEGFGLPVLEAMNAGCPVITSNISSMPEVIGDCGIQINPQSDEEMIQAYEKMYFDDDFRALCRKKGFERAKEFSWKKCANIMYEQFCKDLCNKDFS